MLNNSSRELEPSQDVLVIVGDGDRNELKQMR
jgi:hypothetical protein